MSPRRKPDDERPAILPAEDRAFVRLETILKLFPIGETTWWMGVAEGRYPKPIKLAKRVNGWRVGEIRALLESVESIPAPFPKKGETSKKR
jgi:prophage regulatory protein